MGDGKGMCSVSIWVWEWKKVYNGRKDIWAFSVWKWKIPLTILYLYL